jgi:EpsI family protein
VVSVLDKRQAILFYIPLGLLVLGLPIWDVFMSFLQALTVKTTLLLLNLSSIPAVAEGIFISIPEGVFKIVSLCSGMRYQVAAIILVLTYASWYHFNPKKVFIYILVISPLAFIANQLRIYIVVLSGHITDMQHYFVTEDHVSLGWIIFAITMFLFFYIVNIIDAPKEQKNDSENIVINDGPLLVGNSIKQSVGYVLILLLSISIGPILYAIYTNPIEHKSNERNLMVSDLDEWLLENPTLGTKSPIWAKGDIIITGQYKHDQSYIDLFVSHFLYQNEEKEAISVSNQLFDPFYWEMYQETHKEILFSDNQNFKLKETIIIEDLRTTKKDFGQAKSRIIWSWYKIGDQIAPDLYTAKLLNIKEILLGNPTVTIYIVSTDIKTDYSSARSTLYDFIDILNNTNIF